MSDEISQPYGRTKIGTARAHRKLASTQAHTETGDSVAFAVDTMELHNDNRKKEGHRHEWHIADLRASLGVLLGYTALALALCHQAVLHPASHLVGKCCDSLVAVSYLQSTGVALLHGHQPFITAYLNAPEGVNALWQPSSSIALGVAAIPFELLVGPIATYNLFAIMAVSLSGWSAYLVLRRWVGGQTGPIVGGLVFGFSSYMMVQTVAGHLDLTFLALVPLVLAIIVSLALGDARSPWRSGFALGVLLVVQLLINQEILADLVIAGLVVTSMLAIVCRKRVADALPRLAVGLAVAVVTFFALGAWPLWTALFGSLRPTNPIISPSIPTDLLSFVSPTPLINLAPGWLRTIDAGWFPDGVDQSSAYIGIVLLGVSVAAAIALRRKPVVRVASLSAVIMAILSLGSNLRVANHLTGIPLPWAVLDHLPLLRFAVTDRFVVLTWLGVAVVLAVIVRAITEAKLRGRFLWLVALATGLVLLTPFPLTTTSLPTPSIFTDSSLTKAIPSGGLVYVAPFPRAQNVAPLQWQAEARMRFSMPGGYVLVPTRSGALESTTGPVDDLSQSLLDLQAGRSPPPHSEWPTLRAELAVDRAAAVLVGPMDHETAVREFLTMMLASSPRSIGGVYLWRLGRH